jgi:hypothetical protein
VNLQKGLKFGKKQVKEIGHFFETHRHIGHIVLYKVLIIKDLYIILCVLCAYVFQKK